MEKHTQVRVARRKHPTEDHDEVVVTKTITVIQEEVIPLDLVPSAIAALRADRERLLADLVEIDRQIEALERALAGSGTP